MPGDDSTNGADGDAAERPLETGWLADTPADDTIVRGFTLAQAALDAELAVAMGGRVDDDGEVALADSSGPVPYFNQAVLLRPLTSVDDPQLARIEKFFAESDGRPRTLLSMWPTPDLSARGWNLVGHPAFCVRAAGPHANPPAEGVTIETVTTPERLAVAEKIAVDGYPMGELAGSPPGTLLPESVLGTGVVCRIGSVDGEPVAVALRHTAHGMVNLCLGATLPAARRRGVWKALVWARVDDDPDLPAVAYTSDYSRPGFIRMGFLPITRFTLWFAAG
jgi:hypothetical protein